MFANTVSNKWAVTTPKIAAQIELIVFNLGGISFGIPTIKVDRVVTQTQLDRDFQIDANVEILDLHHRLFGVSIATATAMVIFTGDRLAGIPIDTAPTLISIPLDRIRILPAEFRINNPLSIASHIAMTSIGDSKLTIFILE